MSGTAKSLRQQKPASDLSWTYWPEEKRVAWDSFIAERANSVALFQLWSWGDFKEQLGWKPFRIAVHRDGRLLTGAQILVKTAPLGLFSMAYLPRGPIGEVRDPQVSGVLFS